MAIIVCEIVMMILRKTERGRGGGRAFTLVRFLVCDCVPLVLT